MDQSLVGADGETNQGGVWVNNPEFLSFSAA